MKLFGVLLILVIATGGCIKIEDNPVKPSLPPATHIGANTLGCFIDGEPFITSGKLNITLGSFMSSGVKFEQTTDSSWQITALDDYPTYEIGIDFNNKGPGTYALNGTNTAFLDTNRGSHNIYPTSVFSTDNVRNGKLIITHYQTGSYVAGTFEFDAVNSEGMVVHITDGRFDIAE